ncbi:hypothetical protein PVAP13_4KG048915 [Panicum virgatum]|uniref:Uncharacterized protein n=1 Tax=Panicum virgatum TaxID=38727 RepID=A0A8T0TQF5_PANVG|nr:hypothetical protein PVAP13_4KG048915 [Panicum virgatum]
MYFVIAFPIAYRVMYHVLLVIRNILISASTNGICQLSTRTRTISLPSSQKRGQGIEPSLFMFGKDGSFVLFCAPSHETSSSGGATGTCKELRTSSPIQGGTVTS